MKIAVCVLACAAVLSISAAAAQRGGGKGAAHAVSMDGTAFVPVVIRVKAGERMTWTNKDPFPHTVTSKKGGFDSKSIAAGKSWSHVAATKGEFPYFCTLHPPMKGTLIVE